jgi:hypothetical protein
MHRDRLASDEAKTMTPQLAAAREVCQEAVEELRTIPHLSDVRCIDHTAKTVTKVRPRQLRFKYCQLKYRENRLGLFPTKCTH